MGAEIKVSILYLYNIAIDRVSLARYKYKVQYLPYDIQKQNNTLQF